MLKKAPGLMITLRSEANVLAQREKPARILKWTRQWGPVSVFAPKYREH
jgi:hypothetical protein